MSTVITTKPYETMIQSAPGKIIINLEQGDTPKLWAMLTDLTAILNNNKSEDTYIEWAKMFSRITREIDKRLDREYDTGEIVIEKVEHNIPECDTEDTPLF